MNELLVVITAIISFLFPQADKTIIKPRPLDKYTIENLAKTPINPGIINIKKTLSINEEYTSYLYSLEKVTGVINIPNDNKTHPVIVMIRGFVNQEIYQSGMGTQRAGEYFAQNGYITLAPDFLGYGESDKESDNIFESRFQTYTTVLTTLASLNSIPQFNNTNIFIWGHSNGGQIALTILEITGKPYPTVLWAPVSKPFPYSILYYTDEAKDKGKFLRKELAQFEKDYDSDLYSIHKYYQLITAPLQIHQGTADEAVPQSWSQNLTKSLHDLNLDADLYLYSSADHNLQPAWNKAITKSLAFFKSREN